MTRRDVSVMFWQDGCMHQIERVYQGRPVSIWIPCESYMAFERQLDAPEVQISAVPRTEVDKPWMTDRAPVIWAALQTTNAAQALQRFRPAPSLVLRAGRTQLRWALWALSRPLWGAYIQQATERLAYALHGLRRAANVEALIPSPFTLLDRRPIWVEFEDARFHQARSVVGHLKDAPPTDGWRNRKAA